MTRPLRDERPVPVDVDTAVQLWWGVIAFGLINLGAAVVELYGQRGTLADEFAKSLAADQPDNAVTISNPEALIVAGLGVGAVLGVLVAGLLVLVVRKMNRGRNWARMILTVVGVMQGVGAISNVFGLASPDGTAALVMGASGIIQGVLAVGATFLVYRRESNKYFLPVSPSF